MIKLTNVHNIPLPLVMWLLNDDYDYNPDPYTFSATSLIKSTKKTVLSSAVAKSDTIHYPLDVTKKLAAIRGQNIHAAIEEACQDQAKMEAVAKQLGMFVPKLSVEQRLYAEIEVDGVTYRISGKYDAAINEQVTDWKTENTFSFGDRVKEEERRYQLTIYAWLRHKNNIPVRTDKGVFTSIYQNWMQGFKDKINDDSKYPCSPIMSFELDLLPFSRLEMWIKDRIRERRDLTIDDVDAVLCTPDDLWMKERVWQYFSKPENKRAQSNFDSLQEAQTYLAVEKKGVGVIKEKPQCAKACEYCFGSPICSQYQSLLNAGLIANEHNAISLSSTFGEDS